MSGIYGDSLLAWTEQQIALIVYDMKPKINGGWEHVENSEVQIIGVFQNTRGGQVKDSNGNLVKTNGCELWTAEGEIDGKFINKDGKVYRLNASNDWSYEAGFYKYSLETVVGNNGTEHDDTTWNTGSHSFG